MVYLFVIVLLLFFVLRYDINGKKQFRNECYRLMLIIFILIAGLRYRLGVDTTRYLNDFYYFTPKLGELTWEHLEIGNDPLFLILNSVVLTFGGKFYIVQILNAAFINILIFRYIKKHTNTIFICIFIYFIWKYTVINMEEMRASMSLAICLFGNDYIIEKKWIKGFALYAVGCLLHASTILVLFMPLLFFLRFNKLGFVFLLGSLLLGFVIQPVVNKYVEIIEISEMIDEKAQRYANSDIYMESHLNIFGFLSAIIMNVYGIISLWWLKRVAPSNLFMKLEPLVMIFLCLSMIAIGIPIAHRYERFYIVYFIIFIGNFFVSLLGKQTCLGTRIIFVRAMIVMFPLLFLIVKERCSEDNWSRYHPYSSIFNQEIDQNRERIFSSHRGERPIPGKY